MLFRFSSMSVLSYKICFLHMIKCVKATIMSGNTNQQKCCRAINLVQQIQSPVLSKAPAGLGQAFPYLFPPLTCFILFLPVGVIVLSEEPLNKEQLGVN